MKALLRIETLEARIAPALVYLPNNGGISYTDTDGDLVTIKFKNDPSQRNNTFGLSVSFLPGAAPNSGQLAHLELSGQGYEGTSITMSVVKAAGGDGLAHVGELDAPGLDLGSVTILGDLGALDAGSGSSAVPAVKSLTVRSIGLFGLATGAPDLESDLKGALGALTVTTDVKEAYLHVANGADSNVKIGPVKIGGSLLGGATDHSGSIFGFGGIGAMTIGGNVVGGANDGSGTLVATFGEIGAVSIGGSLLGGLGEGSGEIFNLRGGIGAVKIGGNLRGDLGPESGKIDVQGNLASLTVGGSIVGGAGADNTFTDTGTIVHAGQVFAGGTIGNISIAHDLRGGEGASSGAITSRVGMQNVTIGGSLIGGPSGAGTGFLDSHGALGAVKIANDVRGDGGYGGGAIHADGVLASVTIGGSLIGGRNEHSGSVDASQGIGPVTIAHDLLGGSMRDSGVLFSSGGNIASVTIGGSLVGGSGSVSGVIEAASMLGPVKIGRDFLGGNLAAGGATLLYSGFVHAGTDLESIEIGGSLLSGIDASSAGSLVGNAAIRADREIGSLTVHGDIAGNHLGSDISTVIISAYGQLEPGAKSDVAIGKITVGRRVELTQILAGYDSSLLPKNADAQIGPVSVGADWIASDLVAGSLNRGADHTVGGSDDNLNFGDADDVKISGTGTIDAAGRTSKITSVTVAGRVFGGVVTADARTFGFVAEEIGTLRIGAHLLTVSAHPPAVHPVGLQAGAGNDFFALPGTQRTSVHELGALSSLTTAGSSATHTASTLTYTDRDGDIVTVKLSQPLLTDASVNDVFKFDNIMVDPMSTGHAQLEDIDLTALASTAQPGLGVTVTAVRGVGDGLADVGYIRGKGLALGAISVAGDLGSIDAETVASLTVRTLGRLGLETSGAYANDLQSDFTKSLGALTVATDVVENVVALNPTTMTEGAIGPVKVGGSLVGGLVDGFGSLGAVKIAGNVAGGGVFSSHGNLTSVSIGGSLVGGSIATGGEVYGDGSVGSVTVAGNLVGGTQNETALITARVSSLGTVTVGGSLLGSGFEKTAAIVSGGDAGALSIAHNLRGGGGQDSGKLTGKSFGGILIGGSVIGGTAPGAGSVSASFATGAVQIAHNLLGSSRDTTGSVSAGVVTSFTVGGSLLGGRDFDAGELIAASVGAVKIGHDLAGGSGGSNGLVETTTGGIASVLIGGSLFGGTANASGLISSITSIGSIKIGRDLLGASLAPSATTLDLSGALTTRHFGSIAIGGSIVTGLDASSSGSLTTNASIRAELDIASLTVTGSVLGRSTPVFITAVGQANAQHDHDVALGTISVGGLVSFAAFDAGYNPSFAPVNGSAQIGAVNVKGNWVAANLLAGVQNYGIDHMQGTGDDNLNFGDADDHQIGATQSFAKIASIVIGGSVAGTPVGGDHWGFVSKVIGSFKFAGYTAPLKANTPDGLIPIIPGTGDVAVHEV